jgi:hypothetical protein
MQVPGVLPTEQGPLRAACAMPTARNREETVVNCIVYWWCELKKQTIFGRIVTLGLKVFIYTGLSLAKELSRYKSTGETTHKQPTSSQSVTPGYLVCGLARLASLTLEALSLDFPL